MQNKLKFHFEIREYTDNFPIFIEKFRKNGNSWECSLKNSLYPSLLRSLKRNNFLGVSISEAFFLQCYHSYLYQVPVDPKTASRLKRINYACANYLYLALCYENLGKEEMLSLLSSLPIHLSYPILAQMYFYGIHVQKDTSKVIHYLKLSPDSEENRLIIAQAYLEQNEISQALDSLKDDFSDSAEEIKGRAYLKIGDKKQAISCFMKSRTENSTIAISLLVNDPVLSFGLLYALHDQKATDIKLSYAMKRSRNSNPHLIYDLLEVNYPEKKENKFQFDREIMSWK